MKTQVSFFKTTFVLLFGTCLWVSCLPLPAGAQIQTLDLTLEDSLRLHWQALQPPQTEAGRATDKQSQPTEQSLQQLAKLKQAYFTTLYAQYLVGEAQGNLTMLDDWQGIIDARVEVGATPGRDAKALAQERLQLLDESRRAQLIRQQALAELRITTGVAANTALNVVGTFQSPPSVPDLKTLNEIAVSHRPALQTARLMNASLAQLRVLQLQIAVEVASAYAKVETWRGRADALQMTELPRVVDAQSIEDTRYYEKLGSLLPLLEAMRTRRAVRAAWLNARLAFQISLIELESAIGSQLVDSASSR